jgi:hypothetical protein
MDDGKKSIHFMIGKLHITFYDRWGGLSYSNRKGAQGWYITLGFIMFWGFK